MTEYWPNMLIITGEGRNSGKTALACAIIKQHKNEKQITAIKISPHRHPIDPENIILFQGKDFVIIDEKNMNNSKDSGKMLIAGASRVFYIQAADENINNTFMKLKNHISKKDIIICESAGLLKVVKPGLHIHVVKNTPTGTLKIGADLILGQEDRFKDIARSIFLSAGNVWYKC